MDLLYGVILEYCNGMGIVLNYIDKFYKFVFFLGVKVLIGELVIFIVGVLVFFIID